LVHDVIGDLGGAEANVRLSAQGLAARGCEIALLHGPGTGTGEARFRHIFPTRFDWQQDPLALQKALAWQPELIFVHKLADLVILRGIVNSGIASLRMVHDHDIYCQRGYRYFPWNRRICTRKAGYACALTCGVLRNRKGPLPLKLAWPGRKLRELELVRQFTRHIVVTPFMQRELELHEIARISILPPVPKPAPPGFRADYAEPLLLFVGQLIRGKGCDQFIRACARLRSRDWRGLIIGDGSQLQACQHLITKLGLQERLRCTGWVEQQELHRYYTHARAGLIPSMWPEPIATIGLEFMLHGLPCIGYDAGGIGDWLVHEQIGLLCPYGDIKALAAAMDRVLAEPETAAAWGGEARRIAEREYDHDRYLDQLYELASATVEEHARS
jgi:glycosyltransferase involved in cell wall biosynthesis